jgi:hypothetical protein
MAEATSPLQPLWSAGDTQRAINQQVSDAFTNGDPRYLMKQFSQSGQSMDAGTLGSAMPGITRAGTDAASILAMQPLLDQMANSQSQLTSQIDQGNFDLGAFADQVRGQDISNQFDMSLLGPLLQALMGY